MNAEVPFKVNLDTLKFMNVSRMAPAFECRADFTLERDSTRSSATESAFEPKGVL